MVCSAKLDRRDFLKGVGTGGLALTLGFYLPCGSVSGPASARTLQPNAWIRITADNLITVLTEIPELGQGSRTVATMMLAEELEAEWSAIHVEQAPVDPKIYKNLSAGGSGGTATCWDSLRVVGAQARELLLSAAAQRWEVSSKECQARLGTVIHGPSGRRFTYGQLVETAATLPPPDAAAIPLKAPADFRLIGKSVARVDGPAKVDGTAIFGIDVRVPGMLFAVIARCPHFGGRLESCEVAAARKVHGVHAVFTVPAIGLMRGLGVNINTAGGVAVVADSSWSAIKGREALRISWDKGPGGDESSETLRRELKRAAEAPPAFVAVDRGDPLTEPGGAVRTIEAFYELPFQAHATLEPMNTTVHVRSDGIEIWSPTQIGAELQREIALLAGVPEERVKVHMMLCGGSFGRRYQWDYAAEAWQVARQVRRPVQLLWTREDDMQRDFYRQYSCHGLSGAVDQRGNLLSWRHRIVSTPIRSTFDTPEKLRDPKRVASQELSGADVLAYPVARFHVDYSPVQSALPRAWWRSVAQSFNAFAIECFVDELAHALGRDPLKFRLALLEEDREVPSVRANDDPPLQTRRFRQVLQLAAKKAGWGTSLPAGEGRGIACCYSFGSYIAYVAEVAVEKKTGMVRVRRVVAAVDCGTAVNPDGVKAMTEGGLNFALTPVLSGEITVRDAAVEQSNFDTYQVLRMNQAPDVEVHLVPGDSAPGGMGETGVPPLAPAIANAVFAATGKRIRRLPIDPTLLAFKESA